MAIEWVRFPDSRMEINGLAWFEEDKPVLRRLPLRLKSTFREPVWQLAQCTAGGRIRFRTDSKEIGIRAQTSGTATMPHITRIGQSGFDIWADSTYRGSAYPDDKGKIEVVWDLGKTRRLRDITIYMPLYDSVEISEIGVDAEAHVKKASKFALDRPVVFYGTSITQGGCSSNPGMTYQDIVSRALNIDYVNLGFSGNGKGEPELARAICEIPCSAVVLDHWGNMSPDELDKNLPIFVGVLREKLKDIPIIITAPYFYVRDFFNDSDHRAQRKIVSDYVSKQRRYDRNIFTLNLLDFLGPDKTSGLVDGGHPNTLGFYFLGTGMIAPLRKILKLASRQEKGR